MAVKTLRIDNFAKAGLNSDALEWDLPPNYITHIRNMRIDKNKLKNFLGYSVWESILGAHGNPGHIVFALSSAGGLWVICCEKGVLAFDGTTFYQIWIYEPVGSEFSDVNKWTDCALSDILILNHYAYYPLYWKPPGVSSELKDLPWTIVPGAGPSDPVVTTTWIERGMHCKIMRAHKQFLFALNLTDDLTGEIFSDGVRWSSPADVSGLPQSWDELDTTNLAGFIPVLGGGGGEIIDGLSLRDSFVVYRQNGISVFDYQGPPYVWRVRHFNTTFGIVGQNCLVEVNGNHYYIGRQDIYINDGNEITPLLYGRIAERFRDDFKAKNFSNAFVVKQDEFCEIWFCIPANEDSDFASEAFVHNWRDNSWTIIDLADNKVRHAAYGAYEAIGKTWNSYGAPPTGLQWGQEAQSWNQDNDAIIQSRLVGIQGLGDSTENLENYITVTFLDPNENFTATPNFTGIERRGIVLGTVGKVTTITRLYLNVEGEAILSVMVGSQDFPGSDVRWKDPVDYDPDTDRKIDIRTTGELHCISIQTKDTTQLRSWKISGIEIEYVEAGLR